PGTGVRARVDLDDVDAVAAGIGGQVDGQQFARLEVLRLFVVFPVPGTEPVGPHRLRERADRRVALILHQHDDEFFAFGHGGDDFGVQHQIRSVADHDDDVPVVADVVQPAA